MRLKTLFAILILSCVPLTAQPKPKAKPSVGDGKAVLMKADRDFFAAAKARGAEGWMEFMTEESTINQDKTYCGLSAIRAAVEADYKDPNFHLTWDPETAVMMESGEMGTTSGHYVVALTGPDKKPVKVGGQYLTVWKKQKDGSWKVLWDGGSSTGPIK